jgi:hypothetical protein
VEMTANLHHPRSPGIGGLLHPTATTIARRGAVGRIVLQPRGARKPPLSRFISRAAKFGDSALPGRQITHPPRFAITSIRGTLCKLFRPLTPFTAVKYNLRDHAAPGCPVS